MNALRGCIAIAIVAPLVLFMAPFGFAGIALSTFTDSSTLYRASQTFQLAALTALFSLTIGVFVFVFACGLSQAKRTGLLLVSSIPLSFPAFGMATAWLTFVSLLNGMSGRFLWAQDSWVGGWLFTLPGAAWVISLVYWPIVFFLLIAFGCPSPSAWESSRLVMPRWQRIRWVWLSALRLPALLGFMLVFGLTLLQFETPSLLQVDVYPLEIFTQFSALMNEQKALILCAPYVLLAPLFAWILASLSKMQRQASPTPIRIQYPKPTGMLLTTGVGIVFVLCIGVPIASLIRHAWSSEFLSTLSFSMRMTQRTVILTSSVALLTVAAGLMLSATTHRWLQTTLAVLCFTLFVLPGALLAVAWVQFRSMMPIPHGTEISNTFMITTMVVHLLAIGYAAGALIWICYGTAPREAESVFALSILQRIRHPWFSSFMKPAFIAAGLVFLLAWGELAIPILMHPPGGETLAMAYYSQLHYGSEPRTAAVGILLMLIPSLAGALALTGVSITQRIRHGSPA